MRNFRYYINTILRVVEKIPGVNLQQVLRVNGRLFLIVPKNGTRSIRNSFLKEKGLSIGDEWCFMEYHTRRSLARILSEEEIILVIRDPLRRIQSCWKQKLGSSRDIRRLPYFFLYYPYIKGGVSFEVFMEKISRIPAWLCEKHFRPIQVTVPVNHDNLIRVPISALSGLLNSKDVANSTSDISITANQKKIFFEKLQDRFNWEFLASRYKDGAKLTAEE